MTQSFFASKQALAEAIMLVHPCTDCPIALTCDASDVVIGAVLEQYAHGRWEPLAFFSDNCVNQRLSAVLSQRTPGCPTRHFRYMLGGRQFSTDIRHISEEKNVVADCLSRAVTDTNAVSLGIDYTAMAAAQSSSADVQAYSTALNNLQITRTKLNDQRTQTPLRYLN
ncbi:transposon ty3-g Gag-Pol polyprotein [Plakobranchus ocellatus]|uniref:Transposon ty3-g Gag-Pol polyprotein n=1 Tax=Plakobranchus ocellatus TaxID=259542 RepID=A0AAV3YPE1_9GAST|nr:transposon ty3-g Gag-Pol polyprotein [Plakobranchus ocellatus]